MLNRIRTLTICAAAVISASVGKAGSITVFDDAFQLQNDGIALTTGSYEVVFGSFSSGVFTPYLGNANNSDNSGYVDVTSPEFSVSFSAASNANAVAGTQAYLAILLAADNSNYSAATPQIILTDSTWIVPTFTLTGPDLSFELTAGTQAFNVGSFNSTYNFNGGAQIINIAAVPEPSSFAAFAGFAVLGLAASRRRRA
jgi:hypothetical protein